MDKSGVYLCLRQDANGYAISELHCGSLTVACILATFSLAERAYAFRRLEQIGQLAYNQYQPDLSYAGTMVMVRPEEVVLSESSGKTNSSGGAKKPFRFLNLF